MRTALIDGDIVVYRTAFAAQRSIPGSDEVTVDPPGWALHTLILTLDKIVTSSRSSGMRIFLTGEGNFRERMTPDYKANRGARPYYYQMVRDHLIHHHDAEVVDGKEADDALGANQRDDTVICTIDKDLNQIPGLHYNWVHERLYNVTEAYGDEFFYKQLLTGDPTDNIPGLYKITKKRCTQDIITGLEEECSTPFERWQYVLDTYRRFKPDISVMDLQFIADLLWIEHPDQKYWEVPTNEPK